MWTKQRFMLNTDAGLAEGSSWKPTNEIHNTTVKENDYLSQYPPTTPAVARRFSMSALSNPVWYGSELLSELLTPCRAGTVTFGIRYPRSLSDIRPPSDIRTSPAPCQNSEGVHTAERQIVTVLVQRMLLAKHTQQITPNSNTGPKAQNTRCVAESKSTHTPWPWFHLLLYRTLPVGFASRCFAPA